MKRLLTLSCAVAALAIALQAGQAAAWGARGRGAADCGCGNACWHGGYYDSAWGMPVALVVPPTAEYQTHYGWGVGATRVTPIHAQFGRNFPGPAPYDARMFQPTPIWPSSTDQLGDYPVRGPW